MKYIYLGYIKPGGTIMHALLPRAYDGPISYDHIQDHFLSRREICVINHVCLKS